MQETKKSSNFATKNKVKQKAQNTLGAAQELINAQFYTQSVHCSYYAVLQYMKYYLAKTSRNPITYESQDNAFGQDSHEYILREIRNRLRVSPSSESKFDQSVRNLRHLRVEADYTIKNFNAEESADAKQAADGIIANLKTYFGNI